MSASGQTIESGYGGLGKSVVPHSYAARVTYKLKNFNCNHGKVVKQRIMGDMMATMQGRINFNLIGITYLSNVRP